jgi:hypothetical protein
MTLLDEIRRATLRAALDRIVPANGPLPGAGALAAIDVEERVWALPALRRAILDGLTRLDLAAWQTHDRPFADLPPEGQDATLRRAESEDPRFFDLLVRQAYAAYYGHPRVVATLGLLPSPQPRGYTLPPFDPALLDQVRARGPIWRKTG